MSKTMEQVVEELNSKIPREAVSSRSAGQGRSLSYLEGHYVIDRLNQVFGPANWSKTILSQEKVFEGEVSGKNYTAYKTTVRLSVTFPNGAVRIIDDVGFGDGQDSNNPGKPNELAIKESVTDALKRCAKDLGMSMGLALYDKSQENVEDEKTNSITNTTVVAQAEKLPLPPANRLPDTRSSGRPPGFPAVGSASVTHALVKKAAGIAFTKQLMSTEDFKKKVAKDYGVAKVDELSEEQARGLLGYLKTTYKELELQS